jgi:ApaG protein
MQPVSATTEGIRVEVVSEYVPSMSRPMQSAWLFAYTIRIHNEGQTPARLVRRHWLITNAEGTVSEVKGEGVIGETPRLSPGESFEYTSACPLDTPFGSMTGTYEMVRDSGQEFTVAIPLFKLIQPWALN